MTELLESATGLFGQGAILGFIVFLRVGAAMALLPGFSHAAFPPRIRLGLAIALTLVVAPAVAPSLAPLATGAGSLARCLASETLIGLALGFALRLAILTLETAGAIAAQSTALSQLFGAGGEPMPALSHLLVIGGLALAMALGLHSRMVGALVLSYDALPAGQFPDTELVRGWSVAQVARAFAFAFSLAAPFVLASVVSNVALGVINRAMPQLMVVFVAAPAMTLGALALFALAAPAGLALWLKGLGAILADPFGMPG